MENATKALIIAGGMLLIIMILGVLTLGYSKLSENRKAKVEQEEQQQIVDFNLKFEAYNKSVVFGYELLSVVNLARDINKRYVQDEGYTPVEIHAILTNDAKLDSATSNEIIKQQGKNIQYDMLKYIENIYDTLLVNQKNTFKELYFECTDVIYDDDIGKYGTGRVCKMVFTQIREKTK